VDKACNNTPTAQSDENPEGQTISGDDNWI
jgi:hypothetical protein